MEHLTAFEFIAPVDTPTLVLLKRKGEIVATFAFTGWFGAVLDGIEFESRQDLVIEGEGLGHPYWNGEAPAWTVAFDAAQEQRRIAAIRAAARREVNRVLIGQ